MKNLKKKLFFKKTTISNLSTIEQNMVKGGMSQEISCFGNTCWETCIPDTCTYVSLDYCTEIVC